MWWNFERNFGAGLLFKNMNMNKCSSNLLIKSPTTWMMHMIYFGEVTFLHGRLSFLYIEKREQLLFIVYDDCHILSTLYLEMLDFKMSKNLSRYIIVQL